MIWNLMKIQMVHY